MSQQPDNGEIYFANLPQESIGDALHQKVSDFYEEGLRIGRINLWKRIHRYYFALDPQGFHEAAMIQRGGEQSELSLLKANHFRNLLQHLHVLVTQQKPAFECRAVNTDHASQIQTILGRNILEYYMRECRLASEFRYAAELAIAYSEAYAVVDWDKNAGDDVAADLDETGEPTGKKIKTGDARVRVFDPINVIRRIWADGTQPTDWHITRHWESRHSVEAQYPDAMAAISKYSDSQPDDRTFYYSYSALALDKDGEHIPVYNFYHRKTPACPNGKYVKFLGPDSVLEYGDLELPVYPVIPMIPSKQHGTAFGYSVSFDLLCVQEAIDILYSTILSNQSSFGVQNIWMKPGSNLNPIQLAGGLNVLQSSEKPEPLNLTNTPPEIFKFLQGVESLSEVLSGVNSVARGQPEANLKSGTALALVASQAVQFSNGLQAAYAQLLEDVGTAILKLLQTHAALPRTAVIAGKDRKTYLKAFTGDDLNSINRVVVDLGNPVSNTVAGRLQMAQDILQQGGATIQQYIEVIETGRPEPVTDQKAFQEILINGENEALRDGSKPVRALAIDMHKEHIMGHAQVLNGPDERMDEQLSNRVMEHIQEHVQLLRGTDPGLLNLLGQAPLAPVPPPPAPPGTVPPMQGANAPQPAAHPPGPPVPPPTGPGAPQPQPGQKMPAPPGSPPEVAGHMPTVPNSPAMVPGGRPQ